MKRGSSNLLGSVDASIKFERFADKVLNVSLNGLYIHDLKLGQNVFINTRYTQLTGYTLEDLTSLTEMRFFELFHPDDRQRVAEHLEMVTRSKEEVLEIEYRFKTRDDRWIWCLSRDTVFDRNQDGSVSKIIGTFLDITESKSIEKQLIKVRKELEKRAKEGTVQLSESSRFLKREIRNRRKMEAALKQSENKYRLVVKNANEGIVVAQDGFMRFINPKMIELSGYSEKELTSRPFLDFIHPNDRKLVLEQYSRKLEQPEVPTTYIFKFIDKSGKAKWLENNGIGINWENRPATLNLITDITEKRLLERQLIQKEKLSSLGVLVTSIAHEINNPNNFVSFNIPILRDYLNEMIPIIEKYADEQPHFEICNQRFPEFREDIFKLLDNIQNGSDRISAYVSNLRDFSQDKEMKPLVWVDLNDIIERVVSICHSKIKSTAKSFVVIVPKGLPSIRTEPYALEQILMNLLTNAAQAIDKGKDDSWIKLIVSIVGDRQEQLCIDVSDNGSGMDEESQLKVFDPFYTSKSLAEGTGLGLFVCQTMAVRLKGRIELESEPGKGSTFKLILPFETNR